MWNCDKYRNPARRVGKRGAAVDEPAPGCLLDGGWLIVVHRYLRAVEGEQPNSIIHLLNPQNKFMNERMHDKMILGGKIRGDGVLIMCLC